MKNLVLAFITLALLIVSGSTDDWRIYIPCAVVGGAILGHLASRASLYEKIVNPRA